MKLTLIFILVICLVASSCVQPRPDAPVSLLPLATQTQLMVSSSEPVGPIPTARATASTNFPSCEPATGITPLVIQSRPGLETPIAITPLSLRSLAERRGFYIGAAVEPAYLSNSDFRQLLAREFNLLAPENAMKWQNIQPQPGLFDFAPGDALVSFAVLHGMAIRGHVLVWDFQNPGWVTTGKYPRKDLMQLLCIHIKTVVSHYRGYIHSWDVVNEAVNEDGTLRNTFWMRSIGPEYIAMAFQWAREADPDARLFYNDSGGEGLNRKSQAIYALVSGLKSIGVPIDGVGLQMHTWLYGAPSPQDLSANIQRLAELGMEVHITEMDVRLQYASDSPNAKLAAQAQTYKQVLETCLSNQRCTAFVTWGLTDRYSWIQSHTGKPDAPLLFDENGSPKPAYSAVLETLGQYVPEQ